MKRIIGGRIWNTETATAIHHAESTETRHDGHVMGPQKTHTTLYSTPSDNHFLLIEEGVTLAVTGESKAAFSEIRPLELGEMVEWLDEVRAPAEAYEEVGIKVKEA